MADADVAELADAQDSGSCDRKVVQVQVLSSAPKRNRDIDTMRIGIAVYFLFFNCFVGILLLFWCLLAKNY